jgi:hypothetical protein
MRYAGCSAVPDGDGKAIQGGIMKQPIAIIPTLALACGLALGAEEAKEPKTRNDGKTERKTVTFVNAGNAEGGTEIAKEKVKECIVALPAADALEPDVTSDSRFLKEINGDPAKNEWVKTYTARLTINYQVYKKDLLIVSTKSVEGMEPTMKDVEKRLPESKEFISNPDDGDTYAGRSNRQYYFTKKEEAANDVKTRAKVWLKQQMPLVCSDLK